MLPAESQSPSAANIPVARYAHQVVYDPLTKVVYMHGGNARLEGELDEDGNPLPRDPDSAQRGRSEESETADEAMKDSGEGKDARLDDFWKMILIR